jgi:hypothetical protein
MAPKKKPEEEPVPINFRVSPKEKNAWQNHAKKLGIPLATFLKKEINKIVFENLIDYENIIKSLLEFNNEIISAIVLIEQTKVAYKTENWGFIPELDQFIEMWGDSINRSNPQLVKNFGILKHSQILKHGIKLDGIKFTIIMLTDKYLVCTDNSSYLLGVRKQDTTLLAKVHSDANDKHALSDLQRTIEKMFPIDLYMPLDTKFGKNFRLEREEKHLKEQLHTIKEPQVFPSEEEIQQLQEIESQGDQRRYVKKQFKHYKLLFDIPLKTEEQEIIHQIENTIGKKIELITSDIIFETWTHFEDIVQDVFKSWVDLLPDEDFPAHQYPNHLMTLNGHVILLSLDGVGLVKFPQSLLKLKNLRYLGLPRNNLTHIPASIEKLENLEYLYLKENHLSKIPSAVGYLPNLRVLDVSKNAIDMVWKLVSFGENIKRIDLRENPVKLFNIRQNYRNLVDQDIMLIDDFQLDESVLDILNKSDDKNKNKSNKNEA